MKRTTLLILIIGVVVAAAVGLGLAVKFESQAPVGRFVPQFPEIIGQKKAFGLEITETGEGLRSVRLTIKQGDRLIVLAEQDWPGRYGVLGSRVESDKLDVEIDPAKLGLKNGPATLELDVRDYSWRESFHGNKFSISRQVTIDTNPPVINIQSSAHYLRPGGCGLVVYKTNEDVESGVMVGERFFHGLVLPDRTDRLTATLFAIPFDAAKGIKLWVKATDRAGNQSGAGFNYLLKTRRYRHSKINISHRFLARKLPEFRQKIKDLPQDELQAFLTINRKIRQENNRRIAELTGPVTPQKLWEGAFLQLPNSARTASFGDHRTYFFDGNEIDRQVHMGIDLASTANATVIAANTGRVVFADYLGIYGLCVIIDHGWGLYSLYGHLSSLAVTDGLSVKKGATLGRSGVTGLAGGDHLHFSMLCGGVFVDPIEWFDPRWIDHNVTGKIEKAEKG